MLQRDWCLLMKVFRVPCLFLDRGHTVSSSGCSAMMIRQMFLFIFFLLRLLHLFFFFFLISCGYLPHTGLNCRMALDLNYFYYVLWQSIVVHREQSMFAWYPWHPHLPCFTVALRLLPGEIPGTGFCEVQCHQHTRTSLRPQWSIPVCPPQKWHTVGIFLLWMLIILANDTDMGGALRFLESSVRIQNVDQVQKSSGKK